MNYKDKIGLDDKFDARAMEDRAMAFWDANAVYKYDPNKPRAETFLVDTPPPTVSGSLHMGHVMGYAQTDISARAQRMFGKNVFFPIGWDDNGLPTERRVQNYFGIKCDPSLPYDPNFVPRQKESEKESENRPVSRRNFTEACRALIDTDEKVFESVWRRLGYSYDWSLCYSTISDIAIRLAQEAFISFYKRGDAKSIDAPTMWDTGFQTAVAQAEVEDRETPGFFHDIKFSVENSDESFVIATTRPEFLPACIAVVAHPDDARYKHLFGRNAIVPLFGFAVPIMASEHADPEKGTGIMMVCTFGDAEDVKFWKQHGLPLKQIIGRDGKITDAGFLRSEKFKSMVGLPIKAARKAVVEMLRASGDLMADPRPITHSVKFYEKGDIPLEFVPSRQWFISLMDKKEQLIAQGRKIEWFPEHMRNRFENWTDGLNQDWAISRQRFFGVPFPVWYRLDAAGEPLFDSPILATKLPCDPLADAPDGFSESQRGRPNGFIGDPDVMDTWATSSLTPQIAMEMAGNPAGLSPPFDARNSGPEIIRTWNFYTIAQDMINHGTIPWRQVWVNGWVLDPDRKKMSKSRGNVVVPMDIIEKYGSDAIRLWAGSLKWGTDAAFDEKILDQKRKLVMKFYNAAKLVIQTTQEITLKNYPDHSEPYSVDEAWFATLCGFCDEAKKYFEQNDYAGALQVSEQAFWSFCDNYLEIIKGRIYNKDGSAGKYLNLSLWIFCKLFAPFMPFITEEVWQAKYNDGEKANGNTSVHNQKYPTSGELLGGFRYSKKEYEKLCELVSAVRGEKSKNNFSMKKPIAKLTIADNGFFRAAEPDIKNVLNVAELEFSGDLPSPDGSGTAGALVGELVWGE
ncbi:MAG: valine--tRNA ligase [Proteobacteria bacterium]|nr:valine--tRNA ligase [Pseudomonadota bacterium]